MNFSCVIVIQKIVKYGEKFYIFLLHYLVKTDKDRKEKCYNNKILSTKFFPK